MIPTPLRREAPIATHTRGPTAAGTWGWLLWAAVVFGLFNAGLPHERLRQVQREMSNGHRPDPVEAVRAFVTNDGDLWRYYAYAQATLGRPYPSYFVRSAAAWREAYAAAEPYRPDELPAVTPPAPLVPYRDFLVEYPPGFLLVALPLGALFPDVRAFTLAFQSAMALALSLALVLAARAVAGTAPERGPRAIAAWAALAALLLGVVSTHRYDAVVALVFALGAWALVRERPILLGLAAGLVLAMKGVPLVAFPPLAMVWARERRFGDLARLAVAALVTAALILVPTLWVAGPAALETVRYHASRPVQIESTWGALMGFVHAMAPGLVEVEKTFGSSNTTGRLASVFGPLSTVATIAGLLLVYGATWRRLATCAPREGRRAAIAGAVASLAIFMVCGKVCSPQFVVWIVPMGLAIVIGRGRRSLLVLLLSLFALTQLIYPISYSSLERLRPWALAILLARNALFLALAVVMLRRHPESDPPELGRALA
jgi:hypothetical protein